MRGTVMLNPSTRLRIDSVKHLVCTMAIMAMGFAACGVEDAHRKSEEAPPPGEGEGDGQGEGEGEGDTPLPPGADGEPCGGASGNECQDGLQCGAEEDEPGICTCPQWFEGTWWAEFPEVRRTDGEEYDFMAPGLDAQFWQAQEVVFEQEGCGVRSTTHNYFWDDSGSGNIVLPDKFRYEILWGNDPEHPLRSIGQISADGKTVQGTCAGEYVGWHTGRDRFPITCTFTLTRRE